MLDREFLEVELKVAYNKLIDARNGGVRAEIAHAQINFQAAAEIFARLLDIDDGKPGEGTSK